MQSTVPSNSITALILVGTLLSGSLINNAPGLNDVVNITALLNCTNLMPSEELLATDNLWTLLVPILLPILYIFLMDNTFQLDHTKIKALYQHCTGQIMSFSSSEIIRHFIVSPNPNFAQKCNLTEKDCASDFTNTSLLCQNSNFPPQQIFDSLHSIPNVSAALMGSASVFLLHHLKSKSSLPSPCIDLHPICQKYKFFSQQLWKTLCLCAFFASIYFCFWQTLKSDTATMSELLFSYAYGVIVQLTVQNLKNKDPTNVNKQQVIV